MIFQYIFIILCCTFIIILAIIKIKYPFWNLQPVYHTYDYIRSMYKTPFIVNINKPYFTKYLDQNHIKTVSVDDDNKTCINKLTDLLQCHYLMNETIDFIIKPEDIYAIHTGQLESSFISLYRIPEYQLNPNENKDGVEICESYKILGGLTSRTLNMYIKFNKEDSVFKKEKIYFIDFLSTHREHDYKKIIRNLIQTHEYNQRMINKNIYISLIKKEGELFGGVIPLISYNTFLYNLSNKDISPLDKNCTIELLKPGSMQSYIDYFTINNGLEEKTRFFDFMAIPDIGNIITQIKQKLLYGICLRNGKNILGFYFIKDTKRYYDDSESLTLSLICSVQNCNNSRLFYVGFLHALREIVHINPDYKLLNIENIGHNQTIASFWNIEHKYVNNVSTAYYSYNYIYPRSPITSNRCFVLV